MIQFFSDPVVYQPVVELYTQEVQLTAVLVSADD